MSDAIAAHGLLHDHGARRALHGIELVVPFGQVCGYLGPNGAGKTTTIRALAGVLTPTAGTIHIAGHTQPSIEAKRALGYVPDSGALYDLLSPREHLTLLTELHDLDPRRASRQIDALVARLEMGEWLERPVSTLSKGQRRKAALAAGLLHEPRVLLLDEPLEGLDVNAVRDVKDLLRELAQAGVAVLFCSHVLDVVERLCERAVILAEGRVIADAPTADLVRLSREGTLEGVFHQLTRPAHG